MKVAGRNRIVAPAMTLLAALIADCIDRIPAGQISEACRNNGEDSNIEEIVREVKGWLSNTRNTD